MNFTMLLQILLVASSSILLPSLASDSMTYDFTDINLIREMALTFYDLADTSNTAVFPGLHFTCSGSITSIWFIASEVEGNNSDEEPVYPEFQLREEGSIARISRTQFTQYDGDIRDTRTPSNDEDSLQLISNNGDISLYKYTLENPLEFEVGDILGLAYTHSASIGVRSLIDGGVRNYVLTRFQNYLYSPGSGWDREPLIALEVSEEMSVSCLNGFLSVDALRSYMEATSDNQDSSDEQEIVDIPNNPLSYVFPSLQIKETGFIEKWLFAAELVHTSLTDPEPLSIHFQVLRNESEQATVISNISITTPPVRSGYPNVYEYQMDPPLLVQAGDYVGIQVQLPSYLRPLWIPDSGTVYHELNSLTVAGTATPLIAAQISVQVQPFIPSSVSSFPETTHILSTAISIPPLSTATESNDLYTTLEPSIPLTFSATTTSLTLESSSHILPPNTTPNTEPSHTLAITPTINGFNPSSTATVYTMTLSPSVSSSSTPPNKNNDKTSNHAIAVTAVVITLFILLCGATIALCIIIICIKKGRKTKSEQPSTHDTYSEPQKSRSGFFDNPVYDKLQRKLSKDSHGYSTVHDPIYLELPDDNQTLSTTAQDTKHRDCDSGYAELEVKITRASVHLDSAGYSQLIDSPAESPYPSPRTSPYPPRTSPYPSPRTSPYPSPRTSPHASPRASPAPSPCPPTRPPLKFHTYHTLEMCQLPPEDYIDPRPNSTISGSTESLLHRTVTCRDEEIIAPTNQANSGHEYHELDPNTGGYHRLHNKTGIYVPTQEERRLSADKENIYTTIEEKHYTDIKRKSRLSFFEDRATFWTPASNSCELYSQLAEHKYREILHGQIKIQHFLGSGNFGEVNKGEWQCKEGPVEVAVKTLKKGSSEDDIVRFLQEAAIMGQFLHPNIVQLLGVVTLGERTMIVLEYLSQGDLGTFLVNRQPMDGSTVPQDTPFLLLGFCKDVASGMEYLERKGFVHRDLAARNILVSKQNHCKIGDFGLSRDLLDENYYIAKGGMIPLKWTAPEALHYKKYSTASDVWSFGCLMYEIWSLGHKPFEDQTPEEVQKILERGERLAPPPGCPRGMYSLMIDCWHPDYTSRPSFLHLLRTLTSSPSKLLSWSHEDTWGAADALTLGAPLNTGKKLYPKLQDMYITKTDK